MVLITRMCREFSKTVEEADFCFRLLFTAHLYLFVWFDLFVLWVDILSPLLCLCTVSLEKKKSKWVGSGIGKGVDRSDDSRKAMLMAIKAM